LSIVIRRLLKRPVLGATRPNLAEAHPQKAEVMRRRLQDWRKQLNLRPEAQ